MPCHNADHHLAGDPHYLEVCLQALLQKLRLKKLPSSDDGVHLLEESEGLSAGIIVETSGIEDNLLKKRIII